MQEQVAVGQAIRATRKGRMSLYELAERSGVSAGSLSQIENGRGNPSFATLKRIADALHVDPADFLSPPAPSATVIVPAGGRKHLQLLGDRHDVELLTPDLMRQISVSRIVLVVGEAWQQSGSYAGEVCMYVQKGRLLLQFEHEGDINLAVGDSICYVLPSRVRWQNVGSAPVEVLTAFRPDEAWMPSDSATPPGNRQRPDLRVAKDGVSLPDAEEPEVDVKERIHNLGAIIRDLRQRNGLTLADLAEQSELSIGLLSRLENGIGNPSLLTLSKLASTLDVPVISMYERPSLASAIRVRPAQRIEVRVPAAGVAHRLLVPTLNSRLLVSLLELSNHAHGASPAPPHGRHAGVEFMSVLRGRVELQIDQETHQLQVGDSATYDASRMHEIRRAGRGTATLLYVTSPGHVP